MIKQNLNFFYLIIFLKFVLLAYLNNKFIFFEGFVQLKFQIYLKFLLSIGILVFLLNIVRKNNIIINYKNFDNIDKIFSFFLVILIINFLISFTLKSQLIQIKNVYILSLVFITFIVSRNYFIKIQYYNLFIFIILLLGLGLLSFFKSDIFGTSTNPICLIFYILFVFLNNEKKNSKYKFLCLVIFLFLFYSLDSKFFIIISLISFLLSFNQIKFFSPKKLYFLFLISYMIYAFAIPHFLVNKYPELKEINYEIHNIFFSCDYILDEGTDINLLSDENIKLIEPCKKMVSSNNIIKKLIDNKEFVTGFNLIYSLGLRIMHNIEIYEFSKNHFYLPSFYDYKDVIKINEAENRITQSTPHNSFALIQIRLSVFGLLLIFFFFYKIICYKGNNFHTYLKYNLIFIMGYYVLNDQLFFHNIISSLLFWTYCAQVVRKEYNLNV